MGPLRASERGPPYPRTAPQTRGGGVDLIDLLGGRSLLTPGGLVWPPGRSDRPGLIGHGVASEAAQRMHPSQPARMSVAAPFVTGKSLHLM